LAERSQFLGIRGNAWDFRRSRQRADSNVFSFASGGDGSAEAAFIDGKNSPQKVVVFVASSPVPQDLAKSRTIPIIPVSLRDNAYTHE
jgi:hypothetical protein